MANNTLAKNIARAATDFADIKTAIIDKGVSVPGGTPTSDYDDLIRQIQGDDIDLSNVVKFDDERNVDLTGEGDIILDHYKKIQGTTADGDPYNLVQMGEFFIKNPVPLTELKVGDNFRGKTIIFANTDKYEVKFTQYAQFYFRPSSTAAGLRFLIRHSPSSMIEFYDHSQPMQYIYGGEPPGWHITKFQIPDDNDYFLSIGETGILPKSSEGIWGCDFVFVGDGISGQQAEIGSGDIHTNINSSDRPTWENQYGKRGLATLNDLSDEVANVVRYDLTGKGNIILDNDKKLLGTIRNDNPYDLVQTGVYPQPISTSIINLNRGENLRGKTIIFTDTDLPMPDNQTMTGTLVLQNVWGDPTKTFVIIKPSGPPTPTIYLIVTGENQKIIYGSGKWNTTEIQIPDDKDYFVASIPSSAATLGYWGWEYVRIGQFIDQVKIGSEQIHTHINSPDRPTWSDQQFAMLSDIPGAGTGDPIIVMNEPIEIFANESTTDTIDEATFNIYQNAASNGKTIIVKTYGDDSTVIHDTVTVTSIERGEFMSQNYMNLLFKYIYGPGAEERTLICNIINNGEGNYSRHFYRIDNNSNIVVFDASATLFAGYAVSDMISAEDFERYTNAIDHNKMIVFNLLHDDYISRTAIVTDAKYTYNGGNLNIHLNFGVYQRNRQTTCSIMRNNTGTQYVRTFYCYDLPATIPLLNHLNQWGAGIGALDAAQGSVIKNMISAITPVVLTQAEYDALGPAVETDNVFYFIK